MAEHPREGVRPWTTAELRVLREDAILGVKALAEKLGRSAESVASQARRQRISLRRKGERRGSVLGQPRGVSLRKALRDDLVSGRVDAALVAERMRIDEEAEMLCPSCAVRPVRVESTGLCRPCHLNRLADAHHEALAELVAQRRLWRARQWLHRARATAESEDWSGGESKEPTAADLERLRRELERRADQEPGPAA